MAITSGTTPRAPQAADRPAGWWAYPITLGAVAFTLPLITASLPWGWLPFIGVVVAALGLATVNSVWSVREYGPVFHFWAKLLAAAVGVAAAGWLLLVRWHDNDPGSLLPHLLLILATLWGWWLVLMVAAPKAAAAQLVAPPPAPVERSPFGGEFYYILLNAGVIPGVRIYDLKTSPSGGVKSVYVKAVPPPPGTSGAQMTTRETLRGKLPQVAAHADVVLDADINVDDVALEEISASQWVIHFTVKRVLVGSTPYPIRSEPRPVEEPLRIGRYETDKPIDLRLFDPELGGGHLELVAGTGGGKTSVLHNLVAEDSACDAWEVWLFSSQKLTHLAWPWVRPWVQGLTDRPPVDAVFGESQEEILVGLAWALQLATSWNATVDSTRQPQRRKAGLTVVVDESSDSMRNRLKIRFEMNGQWTTMNASEIVAKLAEIGRTAPVKVVRASQYGLYEAQGDAGSESRRNFMAAIVGKVTRDSDARNIAAMMPTGWDATRLTDNMIYVQPSQEAPMPLRGKAFALFKDRVDPVAVAYSKWRHGLDPAFTATLRGPVRKGDVLELSGTPAYAERWAPEHHPQLVKFTEVNGWSWPVPAAGALPNATADATADATTPAAADAAGAAPATEAALTPDRSTSSIDRADPAPTQEDPMPDHVPLPANWDAAEFDVLAAVEGREQQQIDRPTPTGPCYDRVPEVDEVLEGRSALANPDLARKPLQMANAKMRKNLEWQEALLRLPDPLGKVMYQIDLPHSQPVVSTGWVPTRLLAYAIEYCSPDDDEKTKQEAVARLGWELNNVTKLTSQEIPRSLWPRLGRGKGWRVEELRAVVLQKLAEMGPEEPTKGK